MALSNVRVEARGDVTINLGNFENYKPGYSLSADVPEGMHPSEVKAKLQGLVKQWLEEDIAEARED